MMCDVAAVRQEDDLRFTQPDNFQRTYDTVETGLFQAAGVLEMFNNLQNIHGFRSTLLLVVVGLRSHLF